MEIVIDVHLTCCNPWSELYVIESTIAGTTQMNIGWTSQENEWMWWLCLSWLCVSTTQQTMPSVLSNHCNRWRLIRGLNRLNGLLWSSHLSPVSCPSYGRGEWASSCLDVWLLARFNLPHLLTCYKIHFKKFLLPGHEYHLPFKTLEVSLVSRD